jgi:phage baseplate assembly protein W
VGTAEYEEDVRQAVLIVLGTNLGERVMRPDFGAGLRALVFEPIAATTVALVQHRVRDALVRCEPRIDVLDVRVRRRNAAESGLEVDIDYRVRATNTFYNLVYPFYLLEGEAP